MMCTNGRDGTGSWKEGGIHMLPEPLSHKSIETQHQPDLPSFTLDPVVAIREREVLRCASSTSLECPCPQCESWGDTAYKTLLAIH